MTYAYESSSLFDSYSFGRILYELGRRLKTITTNQFLIEHISDSMSRKLHNKVEEVKHNLISKNASAKIIIGKKLTHKLCPEKCDIKAPKPKKESFAKRILRKLSPK